MALRGSADESLDSLANIKRKTHFPAAGDNADKVTIIGASVSMAGPLAGIDRKASVSVAPLLHASHPDRLGTSVPERRTSLQQRPWRNPGSDHAAAAGRR